MKLRVEFDPTSLIRWYKNWATTYNFFYESYVELTDDCLVDSTDGNPNVHEFVNLGQRDPMFIKSAEYVLRMLLRINAGYLPLHRNKSFPKNILDVPYKTLDLKFVDTVTVAIKKSEEDFDTCLSNVAILIEAIIASIPVDKRLHAFNCAADELNDLIVTVSKNLELHIKEFETI